MEGFFSNFYNLPSIDCHCTKSLLAFLSSSCSTALILSINRCSIFAKFAFRCCSIPLVLSLRLPRVSAIFSPFIDRLSNTYSSHLEQNQCRQFLLEVISSSLIPKQLEHFQVSSTHLSHCKAFESSPMISPQSQQVQPVRTDINFFLGQTVVEAFTSFRT